MSTNNIASLLSQAAQASPDRTFLVAGEERATFAEVERQATRVACVLARLGVGPGQVVALLLPNVPLFPICSYAALKLGAVVMPLHARSTGPEIGFALQDSGAAALISARPIHEAAARGWAEAGARCQLVLAGLGAGTAAPPQAHRLEALLDAVPEADRARLGVRPVDEEADAVILFTSGTTDRPKGVRISHRNLQAISGQFARLCGLIPEDVLLLFLPAAVIAGQLLINAAAVMGASLALMPVFDPRQLFETITRQRVTFFPMVPMVAQLMVHSPFARSADLTSLRGVMIGGASAQPELVARFEERFGVPVLIPYGLTECSMISLARPGLDSPPGSAGKPIPGTQLRIADDEGRPVAPGAQGEILVRSPYVMTGYLHRPAETEAAFVDGWLRTGDLGHVDDEGFLYVGERIRDLIKTAGNRVCPAEVERVLELHPAVAQAAVIGKPHSRVGEVVQACLVLRPGASATAQEIKDHCRQHLAGFKRPRRVVFVEELPRSPTGKVLRRVLRHGP